MQSQMYVDSKKDGLKELIKKMYEMMAADGQDTASSSLEDKLAEAEQESGAEDTSGSEVGSDNGPDEEMQESQGEKDKELAGGGDAIPGQDLDLEEMKEFMKSRRKPLGGKSVSVMASIQKKPRPENKLKKYG